MVQITEEIVPTKFELAQNYPNPFKEKTIIKYCLPDRMKIKLEIFDSRGYKMKTLVDEVKEAGTYKETYKSDTIENGEYLCKLESDYYLETRKMVVLK
jgi:hypothetical protein